MHYQYASICRGNKSIYEKLERAGVNPTDYIRFYSLRSYDRIHRKKLEEMMARAAGYSASLSSLMEADVDSTHIPGTNEQHAEHSFDTASDSVAYHAMKGGDIHSEPWITDTKFTTHRHDHMDKLEASSYVSEELYIHAKLLIADGKEIRQRKTETALTLDRFDL
jgi:phospholipase D1/2